MAKEKRSKNQIRRERAKLRKLESTGEKNEENVERSQQEPTPSQSKEPHPNSVPVENDQNSPKSASDTQETVYQEKKQVAQDSDLLEQFQSVFTKFNTKPEADETAIVKKEPEDLEDQFSDSEDDDEDDDKEGDKTISKTQLKKQNKIPLAILKASTPNPQLIEWYDADAPDPYLLISMKLQPNCIQVPGHWAAKRDYLANRKGIERLPFKLPKFIADTGISEMRGSNEETLKQQQRAKVQPKTGRLYIDFNRLHDAFFKFQTKPRLFGFGDVYYEGREDTDVISEEVLNLKPGVVSSELRKALGMPEHDFSIPPPWLSIMKQAGKPPTYENLVIPGVDSQYSNSGYREKGGRRKIGGEYWGKLQEFVESSEEEEEDDEEVEDNEEEVGQVSVEEEVDVEHPQSMNDDEPTRVSIDSYGKSYDTSKPVVDYDTNKKLYTVIEEKKPEPSLEGMLRSQFKYELEGNEKTHDDVVAESTETVENISDNCGAKKFKF
jgi:splicing factor 3B subunit 2